MMRIIACLVLTWVVVEDLRRFRIRNVVVLVLVVCFVVECLVDGRLALLLPHIVFAAIGLALLMAAFAFGLIGGGDAKLLSAALLWTGPEGSVLFAFALFVLTLAYSLGARFGGWPARRMNGRLRIPFGPSIAAAWIAVIAFQAAT